MKTLAMETARSATIEGPYFAAALASAAVAPTATAVTVAPAVAATAEVVPPALAAGSWLGVMLATLGQCSGLRGADALQVKVKRSLFVAASPEQPFCRRLSL